MEIIQKALAPSVGQGNGHNEMNATSAVKQPTSDKECYGAC